MVYTGIVQRIGEAVVDEKNILHLRVKDREYWKLCNIGDSIAVNGVCLTLLSISPDNIVEFFVMEETRNLTNLVYIPRVSSDNITFDKAVKVNVEHSLRVGDSIGGHRVAGHVNGMGVISSIDRRGDGSKWIWIDLQKIDKYQDKIKYKGSIAIDGVTLTICEINGSKLRVSIIPHTQYNTIMQYYQVNDLVNIEFDQDLKEGFINIDDEMMKLAIINGEIGKYTAAPNPWVGCVIVKDNEIIGQGHHHKAGCPHAEVNAINDAISHGYESKLEGSTLYVTLEPCCHTGRTGPCDQLIIKKKIARVVVALKDVDKRVAGKGIDNLIKAGIKVDIGICSKEAVQSLKTYLHHRETGRPYVVLKISQSLDGKVACFDYTSQWITNEEARRDAHSRFRATSQAIIVGINTVLHDNPMLTVRHELTQDPDFKQPLRVILDRQGRLTSDYKITDTNIAPTLVFTDNKSLNLGEKVEICYDGTELETVLNKLGQRGILQVLVEGGSKVATAFLLNDKVDELAIYTGPILIGSKGLSCISDSITNTITEKKEWKLSSVERINDNILTIYHK